MASETTGDPEAPVQNTQPKKRAGAQKLRRSAAWSLAVARMTDKTKLPEGGKG